MYIIIVGIIFLYVFILLYIFDLKKHRGGLFMFEITFFFNLIFLYRVGSSGTNVGIACVLHGPYSSAAQSPPAAVLVREKVSGSFILCATGR